MSGGTVYITAEGLYLRPESSSLWMHKEPPRKALYRSWRWTSREEGIGWLRLSFAEFCKLSPESPPRDHLRDAFEEVDGLRLEATVGTECSRVSFAHMEVEAREVEVMWARFPTRLGGDPNKAKQAWGRNGTSKAAWIGDITEGEIICGCIK
jgi:hypothetical protein